MRPSRSRANQSRPSEVTANWVPRRATLGDVDREVRLALPTLGGGAPGEVRDPEGMAAVPARARGDHDQGLAVERDRWSGEGTVINRHPRCPARARPGRSGPRCGAIRWVRRRTRPTTGPRRTTCVECRPGSGRCRSGRFGPANTGPFCTGGGGVVVGIGVAVARPAAGGSRAPTRRPVTPRISSHRHRDGDGEAHPTGEAAPHAPRRRSTAPTVDSRIQRSTGRQQWSM